MKTKYTIHFRNGQFCNCFSDSDLLTNLRFVMREGIRVISVSAV